MTESDADGIFHLTSENKELIRQLCELFYWDDLDYAKKCFSSCISNLDEGMDIWTATHMIADALDFYTFEWNEGYMVLDSLKAWAKRLKLSVDDLNEKSFTGDLPDALWNVGAFLSRYNIVLWELSSAYTLTFVSISRSEDEEVISNIFSKLNLGECVS